MTARSGERVAAREGKKERRGSCRISLILLQVLCCGLYFQVLVVCTDGSDLVIHERVSWSGSVLNSGCQRRVTSRTHSLVLEPLASSLVNTDYRQPKLYTRAPHPHPFSPTTFYNNPVPSARHASASLLLSSLSLPTPNSNLGSTTALPPYRYQSLTYRYQSLKTTTKVVLEQKMGAGQSQILAEMEQTSNCASLPLLLLSHLHHFFLPPHPLAHPPSSLLLD